MAGDPLAYSPHLRKAPLAGMPAKRMLIQFHRGDRNFANPQSSALIRAGALNDRTTYYRHDLAVASDAQLDRNPHQLLQNLHAGVTKPITLALQRQAADFIAADGEVMPQPQPAGLYEVPIRGRLPEVLNFIP